MDKEELKDEICGDLGEMEVLIQTRDTKNEYYAQKNQYNDSLSIRTLWYQDIQIDKYEALLTQTAQRILNLCKQNDGFIEELIKEKLFEDYPKEVYSYILKEILNEVEYWKNIVETEFIRAINDFKNSPSDIDFWDRFVSIGDKIPENFYDTESKFYKKLIFELSSSNLCLVYWAMIILWKKGYSNHETVEAFKKNLKHSDWRIRRITYECLETWKSEEVIQIKTLGKLSLKDKLLKRLRRNFEGELLAP